jgi:hypothetical protein
MEDSQTNRQNGYPINLLLFFENKKSRLIIIASETIITFSRPETFTVLRKLKEKPKVLCGSSD